MVWAATRTSLRLDGAGGGRAGAPRSAGAAGRPGRVAGRHRPAQRVVRRLRAHAARDSARGGPGGRGRPGRRPGPGRRPADFARRLVDWARSARRAIRVIVVERDTQTLALARPVCATYPEIRLVAADAAALPIRESAADIVTSALTLHPLEPAAAVASLREMAAVARRAVVVAQHH